MTIPRRMRSTPARICYGARSPCRSSGRTTRSSGSTERPRLARARAHGSALEPQHARAGGGRRDRLPGRGIVDAAASGGRSVLNRSRADGANADRYEEWYAGFRVLPGGLRRWDGGVFCGPWRGQHDRRHPARHVRVRRHASLAHALVRQAWTLAPDRRTASGFIAATSSIGLTHYEDVRVAGRDARRRGQRRLPPGTAPPTSWTRRGPRTSPDRCTLLSWNASARISDGNEVAFFLGKRRGGPRAPRARATSCSRSRASRRGS